MLIAVHKHLVASVETFLLRALRLPRPRRSIIHDLAFLPTLSAPPRHEIERTVLYISCVIAGGAGGGRTLLTEVREMGGGATNTDYWVYKLV